MNSKQLVEKLAKKYPKAKKIKKGKNKELLDGIVLEYKDYAIYVRGSSNENKLTVNVNASTKEKLNEIVRDVFSKLNQIEPGIKSKLNKKLEAEK